MRRFFTTTVLVATLCALGAGTAHAQFNIGQASQLFSNTTNPSTGFVGYHLISVTSDPNNLPFGVSFDLGTASSYTPEYEMGLERTNTDFYLLSRLISPYSAQFRLRGDTGQLQLGAAVGHPTSTNQLNVVAGHDTSPVITLDGIGISINGNQSNLNLTQRSSGTTTKRTSITFGTPSTGYQVGSDSAGTGTNDWYLKDLTTSAFPLTVSAGTDLVTVGNGATLNGTVTIPGTLALGTSGSTLGFYGNTPMGRPTITGCRSDGTAVANLLQKLQQAGLITDQTTP
jgi:hypothetical protein